MPKKDTTAAMWRGAMERGVTPFEMALALLNNIRYEEAHLIMDKLRELQKEVDIDDPEPWRDDNGKKLTGSQMWHKALDEAMLAVDERIGWLIHS